MSGMRKETEEKYKKISRLHAQGKKKAEIAEKLHCTPSTIDRALRLYREIPRRDTFEDHKKTIVSLYEAGETLEKMSQETGLSIKTINRNLMAMGLRRGRGWKPADHRQRNRTGVYTQAELEEEIELFPLTYAKDTRKAERIVIRGKAYLDVSAWFM